MLIFRNKKDSGRTASSIELLVVEAPAESGVTAGMSFSLDCGDNMLGRDATCEVVLKGSTISRRHAHIRVSYGGNHAVLTDMGSVNGTLIRPSTRLRKQSHPLQPGSEIQIGEVTLRLMVVDGGDEAYTMVAPTDDS